MQVGQNLHQVKRNGRDGVTPLRLTVHGRHARLECRAPLAVAGTACWMDVSKQLAWFIHIR